MPKKSKKIDLPDSIIPIECADKEGVRKVEFWP